jgi:hypothetical protein
MNFRWLTSASERRNTGFADIEPRLVEIRIHRHGEDQVLRLTAEQADKIAAGLARAAAKARQ